MIKKVGILANGGDVSGFNAVIRAIVKTAENHGVECYGIIDGYNGLIKKDFELLSTAEGGEALGILPKGGSIIGSSTNANLFNYKVVNEDGSVEYKDLSDEAIQNIKDFGFDCIFTLGGDGTQKSARDFSIKGVNVIGVPKTIDNDVACTEITFGYNTAVSVAMEALDRLHTTGATHHRIMVLEVMGRYAGWIALESAIAGGADVALIPEIPYDINKVADIWLDTNIKAHNFIPAEYWKSNFKSVKEALLLAEVYVYEYDTEIQGFIGLNDEYVEGIFVSGEMQSQGIGKILLNYAKDKRNKLHLNVYQKNARAISFYKREGFEIQHSGLDEATGEKDYVMTWQHK